jgi:hypothetical protein
MKLRIQLIQCLEYVLKFIQIRYPIPELVHCGGWRFHCKVDPCITANPLPPDEDISLQHTMAHLVAYKLIDRGAPKYLQNNYDYSMHRLPFGPHT